MSSLRGPAFLILAALGAGLLFMSSRTDRAPADAGPMAAPQASALAEPAVSLVGDAPSDPAVLQVFKSPTCGCCNDWIEHLREAGFTVDVKDIPNMLAVKAELGMPGEMASCHTARIAGYLIEGHVPAQDIRRMLAERPDIRGIAVPGMPVGSPGMEVEGQPADAYDVLAFDARGQTSVYASY
ncbi:MAG TPA: DUF411 domain-containing protein [Longimicrobiales bacterium]|nr:DUF411 domain-containing protein [Longimicrobiales bacterium]